MDRYTQTIVQRVPSLLSLAGLMQQLVCITTHQLLDRDAMAAHSSGSRRQDEKFRAPLLQRVARDLLLGSVAASRYASYFCAREVARCLSLYPLSTLHQLTLLR
eukprot:scaffold306506_cov30-Tisochrysis_lutea.AAC.2